MQAAGGSEREEQGADVMLTASMISDMPSVTGQAPASLGPLSDGAGNAVGGPSAPPLSSEVSWVPAFPTQDSEGCATLEVAPGQPSDSWREQRGAVAGSPMEAMPGGVLQSIFQWLRFADLSSCAAVCHFWRDVVGQDELLLLHLPIKRRSSPPPRGLAGQQGVRGGRRPAGTTGRRRQPLPVVLQRAAEVGNVAAIVLVAEEMDLRGDHIEALEWYRRAARKGHQGSQYRVGEAYYRGEGDWPQDGEEALVWLLRAFRNPRGEQRLGAASALLLGYMYLDGEGTQRADNTEAVKWFKLAGRMGSLEAEKTVGWLWNTGQY